MLPKLAILTGTLAAAALWGADGYTLTSVNTTPGTDNPVLIVNTKGARPSSSDEQAYGNADNWKVYRREKIDGPPVKRKVAGVKIHYDTQDLDLSIEADAAHPGDGHDQFWTVEFTPPESMAAVPVVLNYPAASSPSACDRAKSFFCSVSGSDQPNVLLSGSFIAGGNTKPIYALKEQVSLYTPQQKLFRYGIQSAVAINQSASPPNNRTRFDPNSLSAAFSLYNVTPIGGQIVYGLMTTINPAGGEFSRGDPSANFISSFQEQFILTFPKPSKSTFFTLYPLVGMEGGKNLNQPAKIGGVVANLSGYSGIARGVVGSDATYAVEKADRTGSLFSIQGTWRMRIPALDEPMVVTQHGVTQVSLTSRARNWVEVDVTYSPPGWKYLGLTAKYQYGSLPPIFTRVDHLATIGFTLQAKQSALSFLPTSK